MEMNTNEFFERYKPIENEINKGKGSMFDIGYDKDEEFVKAQDVNHVWTAVDGEGTSIEILSGFHRFNRLGYYVTEKPWETGNEHVID